MTVYVGRLCPVCGYRIGLSSKGTFRKHNDRYGSLCQGSYKTTQEAREIESNQITQEIEIEVTPALDSKPWWRFW